MKYVFCELLFANKFWLFKFMHAQFCWSWYLGKLMIVSRCDLLSSQGFQFLESMYTGNGIGILCKNFEDRHDHDDEGG